MKFVRVGLSLALCMLICLSCFSCAKRHDYYIFENIEECLSIENSTLPGAKFEKYASPENKDKELNGLVYSASYCGVFTCDDFEFEIYAYEFFDSATANQYFINVTGRVDKLETNFIGSWGMFSGDITVLDFERVYRVDMTNEDTDEVFQFLSEIFSKKVATA